MCVCTACEGLEMLQRDQTRKQRNPEGTKDQSNFHTVHEAKFIENLHVCIKGFHIGWAASEFLTRASK